MCGGVGYGSPMKTSILQESQQNCTLARKTVASKSSRARKNFIASRALTFDIDEVLPVGDARIKPQRAIDRALSAYNRQLLDPNTNQRTKRLGVDLHVI